MPEHTAAIRWAQKTTRDQELRAEVVSSTDRATTYRLSCDGTPRAYLKVGLHGLAGERDRLLWLHQRVPAPDVLDFASGDGVDWLLTAPLRGNDLSRPEHTAHPQRLVGLLASALKRLHSLDPADCPFGRPGAGAVVVHGDACLPNFVFDDTDFTGHLDVGDMGLGGRPVDLAAAVWESRLQPRPRVRR
jgi:aminoglycoside phosphotransferase